VDQLLISEIKGAKDFLIEPTLRQAKLSYFPDHFVEKFQIRLAER
jgi:hypothetical protein